MTRINVIPANCLSDKHLLAEYRELPRIFTAVRKIYDNGGSVLTNNPYILKYRLGTGHVKFFYNKIPWLISRYAELITELQSRLFSLNGDMFSKIFLDAKELINHPDQTDSWTPQPDDMYLNMARVVKRATNMPLVKEELIS